MRERWLECEIVDGLFKNETLVVIKDVDGQLVPVFCPPGQVRDGRIKVVALYDDGQTALIRLPVQSLKSRRYVDVAVSSLQESEEHPLLAIDDFLITPFEERCVCCAIS